VNRRELLAAAGALAAVPAAAAPRPQAGTLRLAFPAPETSFDPVQTDSSLYSNTVIANILEAPLTYDYLARPVRLVPNTAAALPEISPDFRHITFRLRPGIFFGDDPAFKGRRRELVAADYVYSLKRYYDPRWNSSDLYVFTSAKLVGLADLRDRALATRRPFDYDTEVDGARVLDRYTFRITLDEPDPRFVYNFANPGLLGAVAREVVEHYGDDIGAHPVGTGAFRLAAWRRASRIDLERSPTYRHVTYDGTPADEPLAQAIARRLAGRRLPLVERVQVDIVEEEQPRWLAFLNGEHDLLELPGAYGELALPNGQLAPFLAKRGVAAQVGLNPDMDMTFFNFAHPLVGGYSPAQVALRRAVALAYDGAAHVRIVRGGLALAAQSPVVPFTSGYDPAYRSEMSEHSVAKSRALLDLYGFVDRDGDGWRETPDGRPLVLRRASMSDLASRRMNELWQRALSAVGVRIEFDVATWPELLKKARASQLMMWGYGWNALSPDGGFFLAIAYGPNANESNDARFALPAYDRLYERQARLPDGPERDALMRQAKDLLVAYMPYKVHVHRLRADLLQPWLRNFWRHPFMRDLWRFAEVDPAADLHGRAGSR
jgi:ABC-type transport system substrate-binding protein